MEEVYDSSLAPDKPTAATLAQHLRERLQGFVAVLLADLDAQLDARLVRTFLATLAAILQFRHRSHGLLLSELGAYLLPPHQAPAGTKRLSNLLRSGKWQSQLIDAFLWQGAKARCAELVAQGEEVLCPWDESVLEKAESVGAEGLCAVRSSKGRRLKRIKPGFYRPPGGPPIMVPGLHWVSLLVLGHRGPPTVAAMRWWSSRPGRDAKPLSPTELRAVQRQLLGEARQHLGPRAWHIWDRGAAGSPWLGVVLEEQIRFLIRWPKRYPLLDELGQERPVWKIAQRHRSWDHRFLRDSHTGQAAKVGVVAMRVRHPDYEAPLFLVVVRSGKGRAPWYLLTNELVETKAAAWQVALAYARRWQVELAFRYSKSELAMESPRLWSWERRRKLLLMVTLVYAFLLSLLEGSLEELRQWLLRGFCHRTGQRQRERAAPLYRLRSALSRLWSAYPAPPGWPTLQNSG